MSPTAAVLVLSAAVIHATWNLLLKGTRDGALAITMAAVGGALFMFPISLFFGRMDSDAWPYLAVSVGLQAGYFLALAAAYARTDVSTAYPIARGLGPLLAALGGVVFLGDTLGTGGWIGVLIVIAGLGLIAFSGGPIRGVMFAVVTGVFIGAFTVVDTAGARAAGSGFLYTATLYVFVAAVMVAILYARRGGEGMRAAFSWDGLKLLPIGILVVGAYSLVLAAARIAPIGLVAPAREVAIVLGVLGGRLFFGEPVGFRRALGAAVTLAGVAILLTR